MLCFIKHLREQLWLIFLSLKLLLRQVFGRESLCSLLRHSHYFSSIFMHHQFLTLNLNFCGSTIILFFMCNPRVVNEASFTSSKRLDGLRLLLTSRYELFMLLKRLIFHFLSFNSSLLHVFLVFLLFIWKITDCEFLIPLHECLEERKVKFVRFNDFGDLPGFFIILWLCVFCLIII